MIKYIIRFFSKPGRYFFLQDYTQVGVKYCLNEVDAKRFGSLEEAACLNSSPLVRGEVVAAVVKDARYYSPEFSPCSDWKPTLETKPSGAYSAEKTETF